MCYTPATYKRGFLAEVAFYTGREVVMTGPMRITLRWLAVFLAILAGGPTRSAAVTLLNSLTSNASGTINSTTYNTCIAPPPVTTFLTTAPQVWLYFEVNGAQNGDTALTKFYSPDGQTYNTSNVSVVLSHQCFAYALPLAGTAASRDTGTWTIRTFYNNSSTPLFTLNFVITPPAPILGASPSQLSFTTTTGASRPSQTFQVQNIGVGTLNWLASTTTSAGGNWLSISPTSGTAPSSVSVNVNSSSLQAGTYNGAVNLSMAGGGSMSTALSVPVQLTVNGTVAPDQNLNYSLTSTGTCSSSFYIAQATLAPGQPAGNYSLIVAVSQGLLAGGFNLGGAIGPHGTFPGFGQFKMPTNLPSAPVTIQINAQPLSSGSLSLIATVSQVTPTGNVLVQQFNGPPPLNFTTPNLTPATYYTVAVAGTAGSPSATFQMSMASALGGVPGAGGFEGGVVAGGYLTAGVTGYGGFCVPASQTVNVVQQGQASGYTAGAINVVMENSAGAQFAPIGLLPALTLAMSATPNPVASGGTVTYNLTVQNSGSGSAQGVVVSDTLPSGLTFVSCTASAGSCTHSGNAVTASLGALAANSSATVTIAALAPSVSASQAFTNTATVTTTSMQSSTSGNQTTSSLSVSPAAPAGFAIQSLSTTSPMPLTPLYITTTGLNVNAAVTVQFSNSAGFSLTQPALRVAANGTVSVAVPVYGSTNGQTSTATLSMVLKQGNQTTAPVTINVQDLPSVSSYGVKPGDISRAFLNYQGIAFGQRVNQLQAYKGLPGNKVNVASAMSDTMNLMNATLAARNDVDRITQTSSLVIGAGTLPSGTSLQFTQQSLDMMDRVFGMYLMQMRPVYSAAAARQASGVGKPVVHLERVGRSGKAKNRGAQAVTDPPATTLTTMESILNYITKGANVAGIANALQVTAKTDPTVLDKVLAVGGGVAGLIGLSSNPLAQEVSAGLGAVVSTISVLQDFGNMAGSLAFIMTATSMTDPSVLQDAQNDFNNATTKAGLDGVQTLLNIASLYTEGWAGSVSNYLQFEGDAEKILETGLNTGLQSAALVVTAKQIALDGGYVNDFTTAINLAAETVVPFVSSTLGFAEVSGVVNVANSLGVFSALSGVDVSSDYDSDDFGTIADPSGDYSMFIPLNDPQFDYRGADIQVVDPLTGDDLAYAPINLGSLNTTTVLQMPTLSGTCDDTDAGDPDGDDPDCDSIAPQSVKPRAGSMFQRTGTAPWLAPTRRPATRSLDRQDSQRPH